MFYCELWAMLWRFGAWVLLVLRHVFMEQSQDTLCTFIVIVDETLRARACVVLLTSEPFYSDVQLLLRLW